MAGSKSRRGCVWIAAWLFTSFVCRFAHAQAVGEIAFDLPADAADRSLRKFSAQSGLEVVFASEAPKGVRTNSVRGAYTPEEALRRLLEGTVLLATQDPASGAFMINRAPDPNADRAAPSTAGDRPKHRRSRPLTILLQRR